MHCNTLQSKSRIAVLYNLVQRPSSAEPLPANWGEIINRFYQSYLSCDAGIAHDLILVITNPNKPDVSYRDRFSNLRHDVIHYTGNGWDIGAYQDAAQYLTDYDVVMCLNSQAFPVKENWLLSFYREFSRYGTGVFGACSSFQIYPHIRTASIVTTPELLNSYPLRVRSRQEGCIFEHSSHNFSLWALGLGIPVGTVSTHGFTSLQDSRCLPNVFRKGDQSALLVEDRHTLHFKALSASEKGHYTHMTDSTSYWS